MPLTRGVKPFAADRVDEEEGGLEVGPVKGIVEDRCFLADKPAGVEERAVPAAAAARCTRDAADERDAEGREGRKGGWRRWWR